MSVTLKADVLIVRPMQTAGPGGGFVGSGVDPARLDPESALAVVGAAVREATVAAIAASGSVLRPVGSWRSGTTSSGPVPAHGVATVRRTTEGLTVTARIGDRWTTTAASSDVAHLSLDTSYRDLGLAVVGALNRSAEGGLQPGDEDPSGGDRQVLVEADDLGLTVYPQAINDETGIWDVPAHPDVRTPPRQSSPEHVGQAVHLVAAEPPEWSA